MCSIADNGIAMEADLCHAEIIVQQLGLDNAKAKEAEILANLK